MSQHGVYESDGTLSAIEGIAEDVTERTQTVTNLQALNAELHQLAITDSLTRLANRRYFIYTLETEWQRHQRDALPLSLVMIDIDHFKAYNDRFGYPRGEYGKSLRCSSVHRPHDLVARYGGEEFVLLLPNTKAEGEIAIAQRIQQEITLLAISHPASKTASIVTLSIGIAVVRMPTEISTNVALRKADEMLYRAKLNRNSYCMAEILWYEPG